MGTPGFFLTFEGTDGVGKTTHVKLVKRWLESRGVRVCLTREPGGGPVAEKIRRILLNPHLKISGLTELFLYEAARADHVETVIGPARRQGKVVVCDRFSDATVAYQGAARGLDRETILLLNRIATRGVMPHLTLILDLPPRQGLAKAKARRSLGQGDRLENEGLRFQERVRRGYLALAKREPRRVKIVRVQPTIEETQKLIRQIICRKMGL